MRPSCMCIAGVRDRAMSLPIRPTRMGRVIVSFPDFKISTRRRPAAVPTTVLLIDKMYELVSNVNQKQEGVFNPVEGAKRLTSLKSEASKSFEARMGPLSRP